MGEERNFDETAREIMDRLPTLSDLRSLSDAEVHDTPKPIIQAGLQLGRIAELLQANPRLGLRAVQFYSKCASDENFPSSVRALCFSHLKNLDGDTAAQAAVPAEIRELAEDLG